MQLAERRKEGTAIAKRVLERPKVWLIGSVDAQCLAGLR